MNSPEPSVESAVKISNLRILLVDDHPVHRRLGSMLLKRWGCYPDESVDGIQTIDLVSQHIYDLIFMDVQMPGADGYEVSRHLRTLPHGDIPYIVALSCSMPADREKSMQAGMDVNLSKPLNSTELGRILQTVAQRANNRRDAITNTA